MSFRNIENPLHKQHNSKKKLKSNILNMSRHFTEIHRSLLRKIEKILNRPITKFYNSDDVNTTTAELRQTKTRPISF